MDKDISIWSNWTTKIVIDINKIEMRSAEMNRYKVKKIIERIKEPMLAVLTASLIISFIVGHVKIPTISMEKTIMPGDHLLINRIPFYYRDPIRGEIVVFKYERDDLIKRVVGLPGDIIDIKNGKLYINGEVLDESSYLEEGTLTYIKTTSDIEFPYTVPEGKYFMLGDNRSSSKDSRVFGSVGREVIYAKALLRIYPFENIGKVE